MNGRERGGISLRGTLRAALISAVLAGVASCGDGPTPPSPQPPPPPPPPAAPQPVGSIPAQIVDVGDTVTIDVSSYFRDPDGGTLTYTASSSNAAVVSASQSGSALTLAGVAEGTATVTVTAADPGGLTATQSVAVTVRTPNRAPEAVGAVSAQQVTVGGTATLDVSPYFRDPDGDALTYTAASSAPGVVTASQSGTTLTLAGVAEGTATVTVTAADPGGLTATQSVAVTVRTGFDEDFDSAASLGGWTTHSANASVAGGVLQVANTTPNRLGVAERSSLPSALTEWTIQVRMGRVTGDASPGVVSLTGHERFSAVRLVLRTLDDAAGTSRNYEFAVFDSREREWILVTNLSGDSEAVNEAAGEFTEITLGVDGGPGAGGDFVATAGEEELVRVDLGRAAFEGVLFGELLRHATGIWLVSQGSVGATSLHDRVRVTGTESTAPTTDGGGALEATDVATRTASVTPSRPPEPVGTVPAQTVAVGGTVRLDVTSYFRDPDGDALTYAASSSGTDVATVAVAGSSVTIRGVADGTTVVTVSAADPDGGTASQRVDVTVGRGGAPGDRDALTALHDATNGSEWVINTNWLSDRPLDDWHGVGATAADMVESVDLISNNLVGVLPPELGDLASLRRLSLLDNQLSGPIPGELGDLANLTVLSLQDNELSGPIPAELGGLANLTDLALSFNDLSGPIPAELGGLASLDYLTLSFNELSGPIPAELGNLANLTSLTIPDNRLSGPIPAELGNLASLEVLWLGGNQLSGTIPAELGGLADLAVLWLSDNRLSGAIPVELAALESLETLRVADNDVCVPRGDGEFMTWLGGVDHDTDDLPSCTSDRDALAALHDATDGPQWTADTNWLSDRPLNDWHGVGATAADMVESVDLEWNNLVGVLPPELGGLASLTMLVLNLNELSGPIPAELGSLSNLTALFLHINELSGPIPAELGNLANLTQLWLHGNQLSGPVPAELGGLSNLTQLWLHVNQLSGPIPAELGNLVSLTDLSLHDNQLSGPIPAALGNLATLTDLSLAGNELNGNIPAELGDLADLTALVLSYNQLSGNIPAELGNLANLEYLALSNNRLSGAIPVELAALESLETLRVADNDVCVPRGDGEFLTWLGGVDHDTDDLPSCTSGRAPEAVGTVPAQTVAVGGSVTLDVTSYFSDPDGDALVYVAASNDPGVAVASTSGSDLRIDGIATGTATVTVTATDPDNLSAIQQFDVTVSGSPVTNLTNHSADDLGAAWSPDGARIAFTSYRDDNGEIYAMNADGSGATNLTNHSADDGGVAWSPDGALLALASSRDGNPEIYAMNADGSGVTNLTNHSAFDGAPAWSPDGARIAFSSNRDGNTEIYVMNADGSGVTRLTNHSESDLSPAWSPDGSRIAFTSNRDGNAEIYVMNADGSGVTRLTSRSGRGPAWSPDGARIAFAADRDDNYDIYVMNADGTGVARLTSHSAFDGLPAWSPDGTRIAFTSDRDGNDEIYLIDVPATDRTSPGRAGPLRPLRSSP